MDGLSFAERLTQAFAGRTLEVNKMKIVITKVEQISAGNWNFIGQPFTVLCVDTPFGTGFMFYSRCRAIGMIPCLYAGTIDGLDLCEAYEKFKKD